jgi:hypothetical protein
MAERSSLPRLIDIIEAIEHINSVMMDITLDARSTASEPRAAGRCIATARGFHPYLPYRTL